MAAVWVKRYIMESMLKGIVCVNTTASHPPRRGGKPIPYYIIYVFLY